MTLERVLSEIRDLEDAPFSDKNVYDLAMLYIVRDHMQATETPTVPVMVNAHMSPLEQVESAMGELSITSIADRRKLQELREAARIINAE